MSACKTGCGAERLPGQCFCGPCGDAYDRGPEYREYVDVWQDSDEWIWRGPKSIDDFCTRLRLERLNGKDGTQLPQLRSENQS